VPTGINRRTSRGQTKPWQEPSVNGNPNNQNQKKGKQIIHTVLPWGKD